MYLLNIYLLREGWGRLKFYFIDFVITFRMF